jgi:hypothetical protein
VLRAPSVGWAVLTGVHLRHACLGQEISRIGTAQMQQWFRAGYFPGFTRVKRASDPEWRPLGSVGSIVAGGATPLLIFVLFCGGYFSVCVFFVFVPKCFGGACRQLETVAASLRRATGESRDGS